MVHPHHGGPQPPEYKLVEVTDTQFMNESGLVAAHQTTEIFEAVAPLRAVESVVYDPIAEVEMIEGGQLTDQRYDRALGAYTLTFTLDQPVAPGQEAAVQYLMHLRREQNLPPHFRRSIGANMVRRLDMHVVFSGLKLPRQVCWGERQNVQGSAFIEEPAELHVVDNEEADPPQAAWRQLVGVSNKVVGFRWLW